MASKFTNSETQIVTQESPLGEGQTMQSTALDSNSCHSDRTDKEYKDMATNCTWTISFLPRTLWWLDKEKKCWGIVRLNRKGILEDLRCKTTELRWADIQVRTRCNLTAIQWMDKRDVCMLTNFHDLPQEGNFCNEQGNVIKAEIVADYKHHLGYVDKGNRMANSY